MGWLLRTGGVLWAPRETFRRILHHQEGGLSDVLLLMLFCLAGTLPLEVARAGLMAATQPGAALSRLVLLYMGLSFWPLAACVGVSLLLVGWERLRGNPVPVDAAVAAGVYLWVPFGMLGLLGAMLSTLGLEVWVLPHLPLSALPNLGASWWVIALWLLIGCGPSAVLARVLQGVLREPGRKTEGAKAPLPRRGAASVIAALGLSYLAGTASAIVHYDRIRVVVPGDLAPAFDLPRLDGQGTLPLASFAGQSAVVEFWATWCPTCVAGLPRLAAWAQAHPAIPVIAIHQGGGADEIRQAVDLQALRGLVMLIDPAGRASRDYRVDSLPSIFVIGPDGRVRAVEVGAPSAGWLEESLGLGGP